MYKLQAASGRPAKSSFAVVDEQRVVVSNQLARVEHFSAKMPIAVLH